ncbi:hypothetical protein [Bacteriovorax sp. DB6_IX]|uniref:hypothetical protein n=1 Tax=Bacteriovorax sp. DB6_IX TaxID=1353530 RepID=UPI00038A20FA|nr:hypothetical protein [Bacteriovorax sp. DB6_IX]EQC51788.1 hypothetical protein M901_0656 [Bacteriovorax sp. DB6_IX]
MKKLILLLLMTTGVFANECYKNLCTDDLVMDQYGWSGWVTSFDVENNLVEVQLSHGPGTYQFPYQDLGKSVECFSKICVEDYVMDKYNEVNIVLEIYTHGRAKVFSPDRDGTFIMNTKELTKL